MGSKRPLRTEALCVSLGILFLMGLTIGALGQSSTPNLPSAGAVTTGDGERVFRSAASRPGTAEALEVLGPPASDPGFAEKPLATRPGKALVGEKARLMGKKTF